MRHSYRYLFALAVLLAFTACSKHSRVDERLSETISISSGGVTKALLGANGIDADGTRLQVYDYLSNFSGTIMVNGVEKTYETTEKALYFSDVIDYPGGAGAWTYESGNSYRWTRTGSHTFFGWLLDDAGQTGLNAESFFGTGQPSFNTTTQTLSVPATTLTASGDQFDFLYAPAMTRSAGDPNYTSTVPLRFRHLFTAVKIAIQNVSDNTVMVNSVRSEYLRNTKAADINFETGAVTYTSQAASNFIPAFSQATLAKNDPAFNLWDGYRILWPQTQSEIEDARLVVNYYLENDKVDDVYVEHESIINLRDVKIEGSNITGLEAGKAYSLTLQFKNGSLDLYVTVLPWYYSSFDLDYSDQTISALSGDNHDGVLWLYSGDGTEGNGSTRTVRMHNSQEEITGSFYIASPHNGKWSVTLYPAEAAKYFELEPSSGIITKDMILSGGKVEFKVTASTLVPAVTQTVHFNVSIYMGNDWHDANSEFNRKDWKLVREP
jgi:hypothetical protein